MNTIRIGIVMDPIETINPKKDTTLAFMLEAQLRGWQLVYIEMGDLQLNNGCAQARMRQLIVFNDLQNWYHFTGEEYADLNTLDVILMRKDPPFDIEYIMATYILERAEAEGVLVINKPGSLRDINEKLFTSWFPECCPPTIVTRNKASIKAFHEFHKKIVVKPTHKMGGQSIFVISQSDPNTNVIIEEVSHSQTHYVQAQKYIPEIETVGDKRILLIDGEAVEHGIARIPAPGDHRGNLAAGATAKGFTLTERDRWLCSQVGPVLKQKGIVFAGIDVIGDYITEINVTSPTCVREIDKLFGTKISAMFFDKVSFLLKQKKSLQQMN